MAGTSTPYQRGDPQVARTSAERIGAPDATRIEEILRHHRMVPQPGS